MLNITAQTTIPINTANNKNLFLWEALLALKSRYPITRFKQAQSTLVVGEESPLPGGVANGVGKGSPEIPCIKCGTTFAKKNPAKNAAK